MENVCVCEGMGENSSAFGAQEEKQVEERESERDI